MLHHRAYETDSVGELVPSGHAISQGWKPIFECLKGMEAGSIKGAKGLSKDLKVQEGEKGILYLG